MASQKMKNTTGIRILLADDHKIVRQGLRTLLEGERDMQVVGEAEDGRASVRLAREKAPQIIVMDVAMPVLNGIEATRRLRQESPHTKIIALSMHHDQRFVINMLKAGASGYLLKDCAVEELATAIRTVMANQTYLSPAVADVVLQDFVQGPRPDTSAFAVLSPREREVLQLMAEGKSTRQIAENLQVSVKTVETHRQQIMSKLSLHSVAELTKYAVREGISTLEL